MSDQHGPPEPGQPQPERPGPYRGPGVFGQGAAGGAAPAGGSGTPGHGEAYPGAQPFAPGFGGPAGGPAGPGPSGFGGQPGQPGQPGWPASSGPQAGWSAGQVARKPPRQVVVASIISVVLGVMSLLGALVSMTTAGAGMAETLGQPEAAGILPLVFAICGLIYIVPAIFLHRRARWARIMLMVVASLGVLGGILSLPASIIGIALHVGILVMMSQQPTKDWFGVRR